MTSRLLLELVAFTCSFCGMTWLAVSMKPHWERVVHASKRERQRPAKALRIAGTIAQCVALVPLAYVNTASIASVLWCMTMMIAALGVALILAYLPTWLVLLLLFFRSFP